MGNSNVWSGICGQPLVSQINSPGGVAFLLPFHFFICFFLPFSLPENTLIWKCCQLCWLSDVWSVECWWGVEWGWSDGIVEDLLSDKLVTRERSSFFRNCDKEAVEEWMGWKGPEAWRVYVCGQSFFRLVKVWQRKICCDKEWQIWEGGQVLWKLS